MVAQQQEAQRLHFLHQQAQAQAWQAEEKRVHEEVAKALANMCVGRGGGSAGDELVNP